AYADRPLVGASPLPLLAAASVARAPARTADAGQDEGYGGGDQHRSGGREAGEEKPGQRGAGQGARPSCGWNGRPSARPHKVPSP
ncbi:hypothetical protein, partial [Streptomyces benahoarensis]|uniref:hypothetical protein n=1 Tax=Streptomyces benahoarensis TaxID=2595054 RepID=UPI003D806989